MRDLRKFSILALSIALTIGTVAGLYFMAMCAFVKPFIAITSVGNVPALQIAVLYIIFASSTIGVIMAGMVYGLLFVWTDPYHPLSGLAELL